MTDRIDLGHLRKQLTISSHTGKPFTDDPSGVWPFDWDLTDIWCDDVLALVEAVEAARPALDLLASEGYLEDPEWNPVTVGLDVALSRFDFGDGVG